MSADAHRDDERLRDDLAAYALGALAPEEAAELERHLEGCEPCRARVRWLRPAVDLLPASVPQHTPPERLRSSLMETVRAEAAVEAEAAAAQTRGDRQPWWRSVQDLALRPAVGMAALILIVVGIGLGWALRGPGSSESTSTLVRAEPMTASVPVSATLERDGDAATLHVQEMPAIANDEVYEVWVERGGTLEPRSTFVLSSDGTAEAAVPGPLEGGSAVYVTREPRGGSPQPTTKPLLEAPL